MLDNPRRIGILDLALIVLERKRFLLVGLLIVSIASVTATLLMKKYYRATAIILPPKSEIPVPLGSLIGDLPMGNLLKNMDLFGGQDADKFISILHSRVLADEVIKEFDLVRYFEFHEKKKYYYEDVLKAYYEAVDIEEDANSNLAIAVTDTSPTMATEMANFMVRKLDSINYEISRKSALGSRRFFEEQIGIVKARLDSAQNLFTRFQLKHRVVQIDEQLKASVEAISGLEAQIMALEVSIQELSSSFGPANSKIQQLKKRKAVIQAKVDEYVKVGFGQLVLPMKEVPEIAVEYYEHFRDVKIQETLYQFMTQLLEQARFREANNSPIVTVLDWAKIPEKKIKPKRAILCVAFFSLGFMLLSIVIFVQKWLEVQRQSQTEQFGKIQQLKKSLLTWK